MMVVSFDGLVPTSDIRTMIEQYHVGNVLLLGSNIAGELKSLEAPRRNQGGAT